MNISISQAANEWGVSRTTIYQKIKNGELSRGSDKKIDTSEMLRVFGEPELTEKNIERAEQTRKTVQSTVVNTSDTVQTVLNISEETHLLALETLKNEHLTQQVSEQKKQIEQYQHQIEQLSKNLEQANASIQELAQTRLLELKHRQHIEDQSPHIKGSTPDTSDTLEEETQPIILPNNMPSINTSPPRKRWWQF